MNTKTLKTANFTNTATFTSLMFRLSIGHVKCSSLGRDTNRLFSSAFFLLVKTFPDHIMIPFTSPISIQFYSTQTFPSIPAKTTYTNMINHNIQIKFKHTPKFRTKSSQQTAVAAMLAVVAVAAA